MTAPQEGSRVKVVIPEAVVHEAMDGYVHISYDDMVGDIEEARFIPMGWCEVLADPLKVGDILGTSSPEPPVGTIVSTESMGGRRVTWTRTMDASNPWVASHYYGPDNWWFVVSERPRIEYLSEVAK